MTKNDYYVGIEYPKSLRKNILETSRLMIYILEKNERAKQINNEKVQVIHSLRNEVHEIKFLMTKLRDRLSKVVDDEMNIHTKPSRRIIQTRTLKKASKPTKTKNKKSSIAELEAELSQIEASLKKLG